MLTNAAPRHVVRFSDWPCVVADVAKDGSGMPDSFFRSASVRHVCMS